MLKNELLPIAELAGSIMSGAVIHHGASIDERLSWLPHLKKLCSEAREAWASAVFSSNAGQRLGRYFTYHLAMISELLDQVSDDMPGSTFSVELTTLANHLYSHYQGYLEQDSKLPASLVLHKISASGMQITFIREAAEYKITSKPLKLVLNAMLAETLELPAKRSCTVGSLAYTELFLREVSDILNISLETDADLRLADTLTAINFNHIRFFLYLEDRLRSALSDLPVTDQLHLLRQQKHYFKQLNPAMAYAYDWTSIGEMMSTWITEEMELLGKPLYPGHPSPEAIDHKLGFNLSVAHLACLTKVFFSAGLYLSENIGEVFAFSAQFLSTKKQQKISKGSFSKEYYSISQKTAAHILDLLQKMTATIRHDYFP